ncbi:MAG: PilZ domain-containing protein [Phycisphaeraceae bacterium]|nr:PilZ domain-containing protein [Phycisphaeraceae bacterium]
MSQISLKLVNPIVEIDALLFERRRDARRPMDGRVTVLRRFRKEGEHRSKISAIDLLDISSTGIGALTNEPVEVGSDLTIMFPAHGPDGACDSSCRVVRCLKRENGYEIGARFGVNPSAA